LANRRSRRIGGGACFGGRGGAGEDRGHGHGGGGFGEGDLTMRDCRLPTWRICGRDLLPSVGVVWYSELGSRNRRFGPSKMIWATCCKAVQARIAAHRRDVTCPQPTKRRRSNNTLMCS
jgi:hypothetical protein